VAEVKRGTKLTEAHKVQPKRGKKKRSVVRRKTFETARGERKNREEKRGKQVRGTLRGAQTQDKTKEENKNNHLVTRAEKGGNENPGRVDK